MCGGGGAAKDVAAPVSILEPGVLEPGAPSFSGLVDSCSFSLKTQLSGVAAVMRRCLCRRAERKSATKWVVVRERRRHDAL